MKRLHEKLYNMSEFLKLFIVGFLFFYFVEDIIPQNLSTSSTLISASIIGIFGGLLTCIFTKPRYKEKKADSDYNNI